MYVWLTFLQCCTHGNGWKRWNWRFDSTGEQHGNNDMYLLINQHVDSVVSRSFLCVRILNRCTPDSIREIAQLIMTIHPSYIIFSYYVYSFAPCLPKHQWAHSIVYSLLYYYISIICRHFAIGCTNLSRFGYIALSQRHTSLPTYTATYARFRVKSKTEGGKKLYNQHHPISKFFLLLFYLLFFFSIPNNNNNNKNHIQIYIYIYPIYIFYNIR